MTKNNDKMGKNKNKAKGIGMRILIFKRRESAETHVRRVKNGKKADRRVHIKRGWEKSR